MDRLLIETRFQSPNNYLVKSRQDIILIAGENSAIINGKIFSNAVEIIDYAFNHLLTPTGYIIARFANREFGKDVLTIFAEELPELLYNYIKLDRIEFIAQCINENIPKDFCSIPFVQTLLIGVSKRKVGFLKNKVRYISMPDKLKRIPNSQDEHPFYRWSFWDVPFTREECLSQEIYKDIKNEDIKDLHTCNYVPLNSSMHSEEGITLNEFMILSKTNYRGRVEYYIDQERYYLGQEKFELYTKYLIKFKKSLIPDSDFRVIDDDAILFNNENPNFVESILISHPKPVLIANDNPAKESLVPLQIREGWKDKVDIAYIYLETRKPDFLNQFYYYLNNRAQVFSHTNILRAKIAELPPVEAQREIVRKEKGIYFAEQKKEHVIHQKVLGIIKGDIGHSIDKPLGEIKTLTEYLIKYFETNNKPLSIDTLVVDSKHKFSTKKVLDGIICQINKAEEWIKNLGPDFKKPLIKTNIFSLLKEDIDILKQKNYKFSIIENLQGLESVSVDVNENFSLILSNLFSNANRHAFSKKDEKNIVEINYGFVKFDNRNYLIISISNNGLPMDLSLKEYTDFGTKGIETGNTGIGGNNIYEIVKSYHGYLGLKKFFSGFSVTFDILLPVEDEFIVNKKIENYEPAEIE
ncbi:MAG TPA: hypothetical protein PK563_11840 [Tenuifilaceae bacterium]|nr:hypothetical protein [Tenuifilaceae bacterium]